MSVRGSALGLVLCVVVSSQAFPAEWSLVRFFFPSGWDGLPGLVCNERAFLANEGLVASTIISASTQALVNSLAAGSTDFAAVPQRTLLVMVGLGLPVKIISTNGWGTPLELVAPKDKPGIKSLADLKGKVVAVGAGSDSYAALIRLINKVGMGPKDITVKVLPPDKLTVAFRENLADAVLETQHFTSTLIKTGQGRLVIASTKITESLGWIDSGALVVRESLIEQEPATVQKFVNAWIKALRYIQQKPDDSMGLLRIFLHRQGTAVPEELAKSWMDMRRYDRYYWSKADVADAKYNAWGLKEGGVLKKLPNFRGYIENRFAKRALKADDLEQETDGQ
jgi:ABC-type nitrate/sulfonate/bicarbonate transport system substrate-binding protein